MVAATYVENRVTNHKRVYDGASDHWPQRIIDGYGRCRVSIRRTIEMKGCTRTVKANLVAIPRRAERHNRDCYPPRYKPTPCPSSLYFSTDPTMSTRMGRDSIAKRYPYRPSLSVSNHLLPTLPLAHISFFFPLLLTKSSIGCSGLIATFIIVDNRNRAE